MKFSKGSKLYSILYSKCPRCHQGEMFESKNPFNLKKFDSMPEECVICGQKTCPEPGFYYGAMYVSYALVVGFGVFLGSIFLLEGASPLSAIIAISIGSILLSPLSFRYSRMIWINFFYHYNPPLSKEEAKDKLKDQ